MSDTVFRDPHIPDGEKSVYTAGMDGAPPMFELTSSIGHDGDGYRSLIQVVSPDGRFTITVDQRFDRVEGRLRAVSYRAETRNGATLVTREEANFQDTTHLLLGEGLSGFPADLMPLAGGLTLLRGLDLRDGAEQDISLWLSFSVHVPVTAKAERGVRIEVPAGSFECAQIRLRPRLSGLNSVLEKMLAGFLPPAVAHVEADPPHRLIRLDFPTGPMPWQPRAHLALLR
ncbi:hypothetical protein ACWEKT_08455 [Nocardia takedensis]